MNKLSRRAFVGAAIGSAVAGPEALAGVDPLKAGVNIAGLEFGSSKLPGTLNVNYCTVNPPEMSYYKSRGAKTIRLPFLWERLQPTLGGSFNQSYLALIDAAVSQAQNLGMSIVLDAHQYGRRRQNG